MGRLPEALKKKTINRTHSVPRLFIDAPVYIPRAMPFSRRARHVGGFTRWKDYDSYQKTFDRMQRDPRAGA